MGSPSIDFYNETFTVPAPPEEVFALLADIERWPTWAKGVTWAKAPKDLRAGIRFAFTPRFLRVPVLVELFEITPPRRLAWGVRVPLLEMVHEMTIDPAPEGSRIHHREHAEGPLARAIGVLGRKIGRFNQAWSREIAETVAARAPR